jgi:hypothetical protein
VYHVKVNNYVSALPGGINDLISIAMNTEVFTDNTTGAKTDPEVDVWKAKLQT